MQAASRHELAGPATELVVTPVGGRVVVMRGGGDGSDEGGGVMVV